MGNKGNNNITELRTEYYFCFVFIFQINEYEQVQ